MKKLKLFLFLFLVVSFFKAQNSYEMNLGYNHAFDEINKFSVLKKNRNGMTLNCFFNFREDKIISPKFGFSYNYNSIFVKYLTQNGASYSPEIKSDSKKEHFLQFNSMVKFDLSDFGTFKISPQIGLNVNFLSKNEYESVSYQGTYSSSKNNSSFYLDLISGFQFEKEISENLSFLVDLNFIRKFYLWERPFSYYDSKNEFRLSAGVKKVLNPPTIDPKESSLYLGTSLFNNFYTFENVNDDYTNQSYDGEKFVSYYGSEENKVTQSGLNLNFVIEKNRFQFSNEFNYSSIDIGIRYNKTSDISYKMPNPYIVEEYSYEGRFEAHKKEYEYTIGVGYDLFKNENIALIPKIGLSYFSNTKATITEDYFFSHYYKDVYFYNEPNPEHEITDSTYYGKASDNIKLNSFSGIVPKLSVLVNVKLFRPLFLNFMISRYLWSFNHFEHNDLIDLHKYQLSLGLSYKIK